MTKSNLLTNADLTPKFHDVPSERPRVMSAYSDLNSSKTSSRYDPFGKMIGCLYGPCKYLTLPDILYFYKNQIKLKMEYC